MTTATVDLAKLRRLYIASLAGWVREDLAYLKEDVRNARVDEWLRNSGVLIEVEVHNDNSD